jgi:outer membrane protein assembly factor BamA
VENPVVNRVAFEGNHKIKDEQLLAEVQTKPRGTFSRALVQGDVQRIVDIYQHNGRYDVTVTPKVVDLPNGRVDLVYEINEGAKTGVEKIVFIAKSGLLYKVLIRNMSFFGLPPQGRHQDRRDKLVELPEVERHVRC